MPGSLSIRYKQPKITASQFRIPFFGPVKVRVKEKYPSFRGGQMNRFI